MNKKPVFSAYLNFIEPGHIQPVKLGRGDFSIFGSRVS